MRGPPPQMPPPSMLTQMFTLRTRVASTEHKRPSRAPETLRLLRNRGLAPPNPREWSWKAQPCLNRGLHGQYGTPVLRVAAAGARGGHSGPPSPAVLGRWLPGSPRSTGVRGAGAGSGC